MEFDDAFEKTSSNFVHFRGPYRCQTFSLPDSIIFYISKNPSTSKIYQKLAKSCKYFFIKNPLTVIKKLNYIGGKWKLEKTLGNEKDYKSVIFANKVWITQELHIQVPNLNDPCVISTFIPNLFQHNITRLYLSYQELSLNEFLFLSSSAEILYLYGCKIFKPDGTKLCLEEILMNLPVINNFLYSYLFDESAASSVKHLIPLLKLKNLNSFYLSQIPETFNIQKFYDEFLKTSNITKVTLRFLPINSEAYKNQLKTIVDDIIENKNSPYQSPIIEYPGLEMDKYREMLYASEKFE